MRLSARLVVAALVVLVVCALLLGASSALAARGNARSPRTRRPPPVPAPRDTGPLVVPVDVGLGPIALVPNLPMALDQPVFGGLQLSVAGIVDDDLIRRYRGRLPPWARKAAGNLREVRVRPGPLMLIPDEIVLSPAFVHTGIGGAIWRPYGLGIPFSFGPAHVEFGGAISLGALYIWSTALGGGTTSTPSHTLFLRPGVQLRAIAEVPITDSVLVSGGWSSDVFLPQRLGGAPWEFEPLDDTLWHLGGPFVMLHVRFPYEVR